jgi:Na+-translocating ferredoxin:NAD+ oxidoreductase RnfD subunit
LFVEYMDARAEARKPRFLGGLQQVVDFLLPAHITGLAVAMLLYASDRLLPVMFAAAIAIASKGTLRLRVDGRPRHFLNPSNFGITATLLLFPWVSIAPPYHFSENLKGAGYWILPAIIFVSGTLINSRFTSRMPLIVSWFAGFFLQAALRSILFGASLLAALNPMTGVAFVLFSFYMITDPATTPFRPKPQVVFGFSVAVVYGVLMVMHVAFGFFFALTLVSGSRGLAEFVVSLSRATRSERLTPSMIAAELPKSG